jgi:nitric oxide reductase subunit B
VNQIHKIAYGFFAGAVVLLMLYAAVGLMGAVKFLSPDDPLALTIPYHVVGGLANVLLNLAVLTGLLGGGIYASASQGNSRVMNGTLLQYGSLGWALLLVLAFAAGVLGLLDGRHMLELPFALRILQLILMILILYSVVSSNPRSPVIQVWTVGLGISLIAILLSLIPPPDYLADRVLRALVLGINLNIAYPLAAFALGYWLMRRFSTIEAIWVDTGVYTVAGLVSLAGVLVTLSPLVQIGAPEWSGTLGNITAVLVPILYLIVAAHCYSALSNRSTDPALSAHWFALSLVLLLLGVGLLGGLTSAPGINQWTIGTRLTDLQSTLTLLGAGAMALGVVNQGAAELYAQNRRITGLTPFWLVAFGAIGGGLALGVAGVAQTYMERLLSVGYLDTQNLLIPLYILWVIGMLLLAAGVGVYALALWARRPVEINVE